MGHSWSLGILRSCPCLREEDERHPQLQGSEGDKASLAIAPLIINAQPAGPIPKSFNHSRGQTTHFLHSFGLHYSVTRELLSSHQGPLDIHLLTSSNKRHTTRSKSSLDSFMNARTHQGFHTGRGGSCLHHTVRISSQETE